MVESRTNAISDKKALSSHEILTKYALTLDEKNKN